MALGFFIAIALTGSDFLLLIFLLIQLSFELKELECEQMSSQLMTLGLFKTTTSTNSAFLCCKHYFYHVSFQLSKNLNVNM